MDAIKPAWLNLPELAVGQQHRAWCRPVRRHSALDLQEVAVEWIWALGVVGR